MLVLQKDQTKLSRRNSLKHSTRYYCVFKMVQLCTNVNVEMVNNLRHSNIPVIALLSKASEGRFYLMFTVGEPCCVAHGNASISKVAIGCPAILYITSVICIFRRNISKTILKMFRTEKITF